MCVASEIWGGSCDLIVCKTIHCEKSTKVCWNKKFCNIITWNFVSKCTFFFSRLINSDFNIFQNNGMYEFVLRMKWQRRSSHLCFLISWLIACMFQPPIFVIRLYLVLYYYNSCMSHSQIRYILDIIYKANCWLASITFSSYTNPYIINSSIIAHFKRFQFSTQCFSFQYYNMLQKISPEVRLIVFSSLFLLSLVNLVGMFFDCSTCLILLSSFP